MTAIDNAPLAYRGKEGCRSVVCTQPPDSLGWTTCFGWHCGTCHAPCSDQGHRCPDRGDRS